MSLATIRSFAFSGIEAVPVEVQVQISSGLPAFLVVGLPDKAVGEARERVRAALTAMGLSLPPRRVLINLAPADLLKEGSHFDLPMALAVLAAMEVLPREDLAHYAALGELSLDGSLNPVAGVLPAAIGAGLQELGLICPGCQGGEAAWAGSVEVLAPPDLLSLINHFRGSQVLSPPDTAGLAAGGPAPDLAEVKGMETARRALEIAAAGGHNLLLVGPPGAGKSMLAARLPGLLPDLLPSEALEVSMIHSVAGLLDGGRLLKRPPFREPHHGASQAALAGGGCQFQRLSGTNIGSAERHPSYAIPDAAALLHLGVLSLAEADLGDGDLRALSDIMAVGATHASFSPRLRPVPARCIVVVSVDEIGGGRSGLPSRLAPLLPRFGLLAHVPPPPVADVAPGDPTRVVAGRVRAARVALSAVRGAGSSGACADAGTVGNVAGVSRTIAALAGALAVLPHHAAEAAFMSPLRSGARRAA